MLGATVIREVSQVVLASTSSAGLELDRLSRGRTAALGPVIDLDPRQGVVGLGVQGKGQPVRVVVLGVRREHADRFFVLGEGLKRRDKHKQEQDNGQAGPDGSKGMARFSPQTLEGDCQIPVTRVRPGSARNRDYE